MSNIKTQPSQRAIDIAGRLWTDPEMAATTMDPDAR
jgi:hypothetical protein